MYIVANSGRINNGIQSILVDTSDELLLINTDKLMPGSDAFVAETSKRYILNTKRQWVLLKQTDSGSGIPPYSHIIYDGGPVESYNK